MTMMASAAAPAMEYVFVNASGPGTDVLPDLPRGKDRYKGQGDDQQADDKQCGSHFHGGVGNHLPAGDVVKICSPGCR